MFSYLDAINDLQPVDQAVQSSFGMSVAELDKSLFYWGGPAKTAQVNFELPEIANPSGRSMTEFDSLAMLADAMFASEFKRARILELINAAQRIAPNSAGVRVLRLRLAARDREDAAIDWLLDKLEPALADPRVARGVALALFERVRAREPGDPLTTEKTRALQQRALELLDRSLRAQPDDPEAAWAFGMLAASTNQLLGSALQRLLSASERFPMSADIAMATALVYESLGKPERMIAHLRDTERFARSIEMRAWAKRRIELARRPDG
jgi:tetratricopeptide (TPR) repeat protein